MTGAARRARAQSGTGPRVAVEDAARQPVWLVVRHCRVSSAGHEQQQGHSHHDFRPLPGNFSVATLAGHCRRWHYAALRHWWLAWRCTGCERSREERVEEVLSQRAGDFLRAYFRANPALSEPLTILSPLGTHVCLKVPEGTMPAGLIQDLTLLAGSG